MSKSVADLLTRAAAEAPHGLAINEAAGRRATWAELEDEVDRVAEGYAALGLVAGQRVMLVLPNRIEFVTTYLGALRAQLVAVPVNPRSTAVELSRVIGDSGSRVVIADPETVPTVRQAVGLLEQALAGDFDLPAEALEGLVIPRIVAVGDAGEPGEHSYADLAERSGRKLPPLQDEEALAAL